MTNFTEVKKDLENKKVDELTKICKEYKLTYYKNGKKLKKAEIINKIMEYLIDMYDIYKKIEESGKNRSIDYEGKQNYINTIKIGTLVAFREENGKLNTAKVVKKNSKDKLFKLETAYGAEFIIKAENIVWVKTGARWPKGIYNELKGINDAENH